jgi:hypothetical protein
MIDAIAWFCICAKTTPQHYNLSLVIKKYSSNQASVCLTPGEATVKVYATDLDKEYATNTVPVKID